jgi:multiple antibiotic resistance protein
MTMASLSLEFLVSALVTMLVVLDPIGLVPSFIAVTHGLPPKARRRVALRACLIAAAILAGSALAGDWLLRMLSIGLPAFRIAGGLLRQTETAEQAIEERVRNIAAFPLAIPLMAGPGAITATVLLSGRSGGDPIRLGELLGVIAAVMLLCFVVFDLASRIARFLGTTATAVASRILGVLLAALAVQFVIDGVRVAMAG